MQGEPRSADPRRVALRRVASGAVLAAAMLGAFGLLPLLAGLSLVLAAMGLAGFLSGWLLRAWRELWVVPAAVASASAARVAWDRLVVEPRSVVRPVELWWQLQWAAALLLFTPPALLGAAVALLAVRRVLHLRED